MTGHFVCTLSLRDREEGVNFSVGLRRVLNRALYRTRDAGQNFELTTTTVATEVGFVQGPFSSCADSENVCVKCSFHHGDDFVIGGTRE